mgnify:CR=1 FL=1
MAILYGTTADGDSLPVEVNEFGQLVAQGLQGQEGPPGPPGVGQLPPDPFEGAILGWKDNTLAWLGGSVPLPPGTFGPIVAYANGVLTFEDSVSLPYLTSVYLSDDQGDKIYFVPQTSPIQTVVDSVVVYSSTLSGNYSFASGTPKTNAFDGDINTLAQLSSGAADATITWDASSYNLSTDNNNILVRSASTNLQWKATGSTGTQTISSVSAPEGFPLPDVGVLKTLEVIGSGASLMFVKAGGNLLADNSAATILTLENDSNLYLFAVGDVVQDPYKIIAIDSTVPSVTTDGGIWSPGQIVTSPPVSGEGTVQTTTGNSIVLRADNQKWEVGRYVTAPDQNIAARYAYSDELRAKLLIRGDSTTNQT